MIEARGLSLSIRRQCDLLGLNRSAFYYTPATESAFNLQLMQLIDEHYTKTPFYGWPRMTAHIRRLGLTVNHKRVQRLMRTMGLQAVYPKPRTSTVAKDHTIYPYLLGGIVILHPNQVWRADITDCTDAQGLHVFGRDH
jgi:putative transposase